MRNIFIYLFSFLSILLPIESNAQSKKENTKKQERKQPEHLSFNGLFVQADVASLATSVITSGQEYSSEASCQLDLSHKLLPVVELGYGGANKLSMAGFGFTTAAMYGRVGVDLNIMNSKKDAKPTNNLFLAGIRIGATHFNYNITNVVLNDDYWGGTETMNYINEPSTKIWFEIVAGIKVEVFKNIYMGWNIRNKNLIVQDTPGLPAPWYIPGFGINNGTQWGFSYVIGYKF